MLEASQSENFPTPTKKKTAGKKGRKLAKRKADLSEQPGHPPLKKGKKRGRKRKAPSGTAPPQQTAPPAALPIPPAPSEKALPTTASTQGEQVEAASEAGLKTAEISPWDGLPTYKCQVRKGDKF